MTEFDERSDEIDEWIATKMATKEDLYRAMIVCIVATTLISILIFVLIKLLARASGVG